jgi:hypothetical protein
LTRSCELFTEVGVHVVEDVADDGTTATSSRFLALPDLLRQKRRRGPRSDAAGFDHSARSLAGDPAGPPPSSARRYVAVQMR